MRLAGLTLLEVAAIVAAQLRAHKVEVVVVGGSAITAHVPAVYTSADIDFAVTSGDDRRAITRALSELGFRQEGRIFVHPETAYTVDFVAGVPFIDREPVTEFAEMHTAVGPVRVLHFEDAVADRIAAFLHWSDSQSLDVAERAVTAARDRLTWDRLEAAMQRLDTSTKPSAQRMSLARERLRRAIAST